MSEDLLTIKIEKTSPLKTIKKENELEEKKIKDLTYSMTLTSDQIFSIFRSESTLENILSISKSNSFDDKCCFHKREDVKHYSQRCKGCQILYRLRKGKTINPEIIEIFTGINKGNKLILTSKSFFKEDYVEEEKYYLKNKLIINKLANIFSKKLYQKSEFIPFLNKNYNYVVQSIIFNKLMEEESTDYRNSYIWCYICGHNLKILEKDNNVKNLNDLVNNPIFSIFHSPTIKQNELIGISKTSTSNIVKQLIIIFKILSKYEYTHGEPDINYINFSLTSIEFKIDNNLQNFPFKLIIKNSDFSSTTYKSKRYFCYNNSRFKNSSLPFEKINIHINGTKNYLHNSNYPKHYDESRIYSYKIGNQIENFTQLRNYYGVPICHDSFDFVVFLTSLIIDNNFIYFNQCKEYEIWKGLWIKEEYSNLIADLKKISVNNYKNIINILKKYHIRFDAVEYFYQSVLKFID